MLLDSRKGLTSETLTEAAGWTAVAPGQHVWSVGYGFEGDSPRLGADLGTSVYQAASSPDAQDALANLNGCWGAVITTPADAVVQVISDRWATRPLFYTLVPGGFVLGDDFWTVLDHVKSPTLSAQAAIEMLTFDYALDGRTLVEEVVEFPVASCGTFKLPAAGEEMSPPTFERYWGYDVDQDGTHSDELIADAAKAIDNAGQRIGNLVRAMGTECVGVNLTAGHDSRVIAYLMHRAEVPFQCMTTHTPGEDATAFRVAEALGVPHTFINRWAVSSDEPDERIFWSIAPTTMAFVANHPMNLAAYGATQIGGYVSGHMGDPVTGRQMSYKLYRTAKSGHDALYPMIVQRHARFAPARLGRLLRSDRRDDASAGTDAMLALCNALDVSCPTAAINRIDFESRQARYILRDYQSLLTLGESMLPFNDYEMWSVFRRMPFEWLLFSWAYVAAMHRHLYRGRYEALRHIPVNGNQLKNVRHPQTRTLSRCVFSNLQSRGTAFCRRLGWKTESSAKSAATASVPLKLAAVLEEYAPAMDWLCNVEQIRDGSFMAANLADVRTVYTIARVSARIQGGA